MLRVWLIFILASILILFTGTKLSKYGDFIAVKTKLGHFLVGSILIAGVTSLPEVATSSTAVLLNAPNIALGNLFGSNLFNISIIAIIDILYRTRPLLRTVAKNHILSSTISILLSSFAAFFILIHSLLEIDFLFLGIGPGTILIAITYIFGTRLLFRNQNKEQEDETLVADDISLATGVIIFIFSAIVIVIAAIFLAYSAEQIANSTGITETFVGTIMVAAVTSLPELVVALSALKLGAYDMIIGNIFGSNIFNIVIILIIDLIYQEASLLAVVSLNHLVTILLGIILCLIAILGLFYRSDKSLFSVGWDSILIIIIYLLGVYLLTKIGIII